MYIADSTVSGARASVGRCTIRWSANRFGQGWTQEDLELKFDSSTWQMSILVGYRGLLVPCRPWIPTKIVQLPCSVIRSFFVEQVKLEELGGRRASKRSKHGQTLTPSSEPSWRGSNSSRASHGVSASFRQLCVMSIVPSQRSKRLKKRTGKSLKMAG
jgi:hypothetical protein